MGGDDEIERKIYSNPISNVLFDQDLLQTLKATRKPGRGPATVLVHLTDW